MLVRLLVALLVWVGPLPCYICTCAHHHRIAVPEPQSDGPNVTLGEDGCHCSHSEPKQYCPTCNAVADNLDTLTAAAPDVPSDITAPSFAPSDWSIPTRHSSRIAAAPGRTARPLPLYITLRTLRI